MFAPPSAGSDASPATASAAADRCSSVKDGSAGAAGTAGCAGAGTPGAGGTRAGTVTSVAPGPASGPVMTAWATLSPILETPAPLPRLPGRVLLESTFALHAPLSRKRTTVRGVGPWARLGRRPISG